MQRTCVTNQKANFYKNATKKKKAEKKTKKFQQRRTADKITKEGNTQIHLLGLA